MTAALWEETLAADHTPLLRGVYADWLDENGHPHADGWRALMRLNRAPAPVKVRWPDGTVVGVQWYWSGVGTNRFVSFFHTPRERAGGRGGGEYRGKHRHLLPNPWLAGVTGRPRWEHRNVSRFVLERWAAEAWGRLSPAERKLILSAAAGGPS